MATEKRSARPPLKERLFEEFYKFSFYQAVTLLERLAPEGDGIGKELRPAREAVRFSVQPGFAFPPSDLSSLRVRDGESQPTLEVAFFGLIGPSGVLPHWYNELAAERKSQKDGAMAAFFDIFQHRLLSLFYLAWKKYRFPVSYRPDAKDRFSFYLKSLVGLGTEHLNDRLGLPEESPMYYGGLLSRSIPTAAAVSATVAYYFGVAAQIEQFVERLITLEPGDRTTIGRANSSLGIDTICGSQVWENQTKFRLNIGPMPFESYLRFLPSGDRLGPLFSLVRYQVGIEYEFEVRVILNRASVPPCRLGVAEGGASRLGWSAWLQAPGVPLGADPHATFQMEDVAGCAG
jgi:type VI secretion system protein ImpH